MLYRTAGVTVQPLWCTITKAGKGSGRGVVKSACVFPSELSMSNVAWVSCYTMSWRQDVRSSPETTGVV